MAEEDILEEIGMVKSWELEPEINSCPAFTYRLTINEDFTSLVEFGSYAPDTLPATFSVSSTVLSEGEEGEETAATEETASDVTTEAGAFVVSSHVKLPNFEYTINTGTCIRFQDNETIEAFVSGNIYEIRKHASNDVEAEPPFPEQVEIAAHIERMNRNVKLMECDWTQATDSPLSAEDKAAWATYRTALRNLPNHANWPRLLEEDWPTKP